MARTKIFTLLILLAGLSITSSAQDADFEQQQADQIGKLGWLKGPGEQTIPGLDASLTLTDNDYVVYNDEARRYMTISEGYEWGSPNAVVINLDNRDLPITKVITFTEEGFIKMDDWDETVDADDILEELVDSTEAANRIKDAGHAKLYVMGWLQKPTLDREKATVYWAVDIETDQGNKVVNAKAMKLGRKGYTEILWVGNASQFTDAQSALQTSLDNYHYDPGMKYADFIPGTDTVAAVGVGALAYKMLTGKVAIKAGVGLFATALILLKKFWFLLAVPFVWIRKKFGGKQSEQTATAPDEPDNAQ